LEQELIAEARKQMKEVKNQVSDLQFWGYNEIGNSK